MLDIFLGVLAAMAVREVYFELMGRLRAYQFRKEINNLKAFEEHLEDLEADDED